MGKPQLDYLSKLIPDLPKETLEEYRKRLTEQYFSQFSEKAIAAHLIELSKLSKENPYSLIIEEKQSVKSTEIECTIIGYDYPGIFSLLTGVLAATGFDILSGNVFTYMREHQKETLRDMRRNERRRALNTGKTAHVPNRKIIDQFSGTLFQGLRKDEWEAELKKTLDEVFCLLSKKEEKNLTKAKKRVNERVSSSLSRFPIDTQDILYPMEINIEPNMQEYTKLTVLSENTPFFLYSLSSALTLHEVSIERVDIRTIGNRIEDTFYLTDLKGRPIQDTELLDHIKISVLFTKQFTYFLNQAPDPYAALIRFEQLTKDILSLPKEGKWEEFLSNPHILQDLARILGTSTYLWEDFVRLQYENLIPILSPHLKDEYISNTGTDYYALITRHLEKGNSKEEKTEILNKIKDQEIFKIDLDHILNPEADFIFLSKSLKQLAEAVVQCSIDLEHSELSKTHGIPRTVGNLEATYAVMGLGKLGGIALGYASDIELLFIYSDNGTTDGPEPIGNNQFFEKLFKGAVNTIHAKREGIFRIDLRLRPHGSAGPIACSLENFTKYYGQHGEAHSFERLALVRMRAIGGNGEFGKRIERLRDGIIYESDTVDLSELSELRKRQFEEKVKGKGTNAKFSPGGLVDLEYTVQILQIMHGKTDESLRTPRIHTALKGFVQSGLMEQDESLRIVEAYHFLRKLINGLRMLRGSAKDLFLPPVDSDEYMHLARRTGYKAAEYLSPADRLHMEFETKTATVRNFVDTYLGRDSIPGPPGGNIADIVLSDTLPAPIVEKILSQAGFQNTEIAERNIRKLAETKSERETFAPLSVLAVEVLERSPDPDMALNNLEHFSREQQDRLEFYRTLLSQPRRLDILLQIFAASQFLADTLIQNPDFFSWVTGPEILHTLRSEETLHKELSFISDNNNTNQDWLRELRRYRNREILRIGTRDICLKYSCKDIITELSNLASAIIRSDLTRILQQLMGKEAEKSTFCILAFGKLGGQELNYSSDIDLLGIYRQEDKQNHKIYHTALQQLRNDLSRHTEEGWVYRVDFRLRPYGTAGLLVSPVSTVEKYFETSASEWELQACLKLRPIAGHLPSGIELTDFISKKIKTINDKYSIISSIRSLREQAVKKVTRTRTNGIDIKNGKGGIRDIEFLLQGLQLIHAREIPKIQTGNTMEGLRKLAESGIIQKQDGVHLKKDYIFLRRVEHLLQIFDDRQTHTLPQTAETLSALAKRVDNNFTDSENFLKTVHTVMERVRKYFENYLDASA